MNATEKYNGWTNYETWNVKLWLDNDEGSYRYWGATAQEVYDEAEADDSFTKAERAALDLADRLKDEINEAAPDLGASCFADLLGAALSEVDWMEIANALIEDEVEQEAEEADEDE